MWRLSLIFLLAGCTVVGHQATPGWPELQVREHFVSHAAMRDKCVPFVGFGMSPEACAIFDLNAKTCDIYYSADFPPSESVKAHERLHCAGNDHIGGAYMQNLVEQWKGAK